MADNTGGRLPSVDSGMALAVSLSAEVAPFVPRVLVVVVVVVVDGTNADFGELKFIAAVVFRVGMSVGGTTKQVPRQDTTSANPRNNARGHIRWYHQERIMSCVAVIGWSMHQEASTETAGVALHEKSIAPQFLHFYFLCGA